MRVGGKEQNDARGQARPIECRVYAVGGAGGVSVDKGNQEQQPPHALNAMDTRESGPHIAAILVAGLKESRVDVTFADVLTTPGVACLVRQNDFDCGVVIS